MIERIKITNFQIHQTYDLELDPYITCIVGPSDQGKSTILDAIRWVAQNVPSGTDFITHDEKYSQCILWVDGHKLLRRKGDKNLYKLDGKEFTALKASGVPQEIVDLLNVTDANFHNQLDSHFWFSLTPGQVSKELNNVINLGSIDDSLTNAATELRQVRSELSICHSRIDEAQGKKESLSWVPEFGTALTELEELIAKSETSKEDITLLESYMLSINRLQEKQRHLAPAKITGQELLELCAELEEITKDQMSLIDLVCQIEELETCQIGKQLSDAQKELKEKTAGMMCPLCGTQMT